MQKGEFRISRFTRHTYAFLLLLIFMAPVHAVTVTALTSDLPTTIIEGENPTYTLTVSNPDTQTATISVSILDNGVDSTALFMSLSPVCTIVAGVFSCGSIASGATQSYLFTRIVPPLAGEHVLTFNVSCTFDGTCTPATAQITTSVIAESVSVTDITDTALPGGTVTQTFTVIDSLPTEITTANPDSLVTPTSLLAGGGDVVYSLTVPTTAVDNQVITDTITITDDAGNITTIRVSVTVTGDFSDLPGLTSSERELAVALDNACAALSGTEILVNSELAAKLLEICTALDSATIQDQVTAIQQMTPKQAPAQGTSSVEISRRQFDNITSRMKALRSGVSGANITGLSVDYQGVSLPINLLSKAMGTPSGGSAGEENSSLFGRFGFFLNGNLSFGDKEGSSNELGFDFDTQGLTAGLDYRFTDQFVVGGALGYVSSDTEFDTSRGDMDVDGYTLAVYSTYYHSAASYLDAIISYGWNDFASNRRLSFLSFSEEASGDTDGTEYSISVGGGYDFNRNGLSFGPFARFNYVNADIDGYTEDTVTGLELVYEDQNVESLTTLLGGQISYAISTSRGVFTPHLRLEWAHEFKDDSRFIQAQFLHDPTSTVFRLETDNPDRDYFNLGAGVSATFGAGKSGYLYYEALLGQEDVKQHSLAAGIRIEF